MLTETEYNDLRGKIDTFNRWLGGRTCYRMDEVPAGMHYPTNEERSACEVYEFCNNPPERYFVYIKREGERGRAVATTWTGERLGAVWLGRAYRDNFGGERVPVTIEAINGVRYHGTYYSSAGDYARIRAFKQFAHKCGR